MFQCNKHVEMNMFLCILHVSEKQVIDNQFYIIYSLSLDVHSNEMLTWWLPGCIAIIKHDICAILNISCNLVIVTEK